MLGMRVSLAEARDLVAGVDADGSGAVDFSEFLQARRRPGSGGAELGSVTGF
jgi:Ca2+-binding EF-hand superfamily protein